MLAIRIPLTSTAAGQCILCNGSHGQKLAILGIVYLQHILGCNVIGAPAEVICEAQKAVGAPTQVRILRRLPGAHASANGQVPNLHSRIIVRVRQPHEC